MVGALKLLFIWSAFKTNGTARRRDIWSASLSSFASPFVQLVSWSWKHSGKMCACMNINNPRTVDTGRVS